MRVALTSISGVGKVEVSLNQGSATIDLNAGNSVTMKQLQDAIAKNGFVTKQSQVEVAGILRSENGKLRIEVAGTHEVYDLAPQSAQGKAEWQSLVGNAVIVSGIVPETPAGKLPTLIQYRGIAMEGGDAKGANPR